LNVNKEKIFNPGSRLVYWLPLAAHNHEIRVQSLLGAPKFVQSIIKIKMLANMAIAEGHKNKKQKF
jgi:hypothetical protein